MKTTIFATLIASVAAQGTPDCIGGGITGLPCGNLCLRNDTLGAVICVNDVCTFDETNVDETIQKLFDLGLESPESIAASNCYTPGNECVEGLFCDYMDNEVCVNATCKKQNVDVFTCGSTYCDVATEGCKYLNECFSIADDCAFMDATDCGKAFNRVTNGQLEFVAITDVCPNVNCNPTNPPTSTAVETCSAIGTLLVPMLVSAFLS